MVNKVNPPWSTVVLLLVAVSLVPVAFSQTADSSGVFSICERGRRVGRVLKARGSRRCRVRCVEGCLLLPGSGLGRVLCPRIFFYFWFKMGHFSFFCFQCPPPPYIRHRLLDHWDGPLSRTGLLSFFHWFCAYQPRMDGLLEPWWQSLFQ